MLELRRGPQIVWLYIDGESSSPQRKNSKDNTDRRRCWIAKRSCTKGPCILQIIAGITITTLFAVAVTVPFIIVQQKTTTTTITSTTGTTAITTTTTATTTTITTTTTTTTATTTTTTATTTTTTATTTTTTATTTTTTATTTTTTATTTTTTATTTTTTAACYFGDDYVDLVQGGRRRIGSLKVGDRIWTLSSDGKRLVEDEIFCIPHAGPNTPTYFYTFTTIEGHTVSMTDSHYIVILDKDEKKMKTIRASQVTFQDQLIMAGRTIDIKKIVYSVRIGFYSPITLSGYLLVNNLSTSVYVDSLQAPHGFLHRIAGPFRIYYRITRWLFGNNYIPFATSVTEELHPISTFIITNYELIRLFFITFPFIIPIISIVLVTYLTQRIFFYGADYYYYYYLKMMRCISK